MSGYINLSDADKPKRQDVIFLFGAGASVDAGVPDTYKFVEDFESYVKEVHPEFYETLLKILKIREVYNIEVISKERPHVDVEQLLDTLRRLIEREKEPLLYFYEEKQFCSDLKQGNFSELERLLQNFIRKKVIVEEEDNLEYLKELLKFDPPLEVFSTNYDTCIEQLCYLTHRRYTDGFDIYWNEENFEEYSDVKHYKLHGSVIWYQNMKTKECVKIPVHAFGEEKPLDLRLIYGEDVKPLLIYPAQKAEYVEPLTDLQLMFKKRLFLKETKFVVVVGYSFRDDYIVHMLWDAARANNDLHVVLIGPNAQEHFDRKLKYIDKSKNALSRIHDRVVCLPYPFSTVVYQLKNNYLRTLEYICRLERDFINSEKTGGTPAWQDLLRICLEGEFLTKAETILGEKIRKSWDELEFNPPQNRLILAFIGLLHSVSCRDSYEDRWLKRVNDTLRMFSVENLHLSSTGRGLALFHFRQNDNNYDLKQFLKEWIAPLVTEKRKKTELLSPKFEKSLERINPSLNKLEEFHNYLDNLAKGVSWVNYKEAESDSAEVKSFMSQFESARKSGVFISPEPDSLILGVERGRLKSFLGAESFEFRLQQEQNP